MIGFIDTRSQSSGLQAVQRYRYSTQFPVHRCTRIRILSLISRILATDLSISLALTHEVFFSQPNSLLAIILQLPFPMTRLFTFDYGSLLN
jgi:hypothetical protein